ncbi:50S ribosomal protein L37ae [Candidatus Bathyarchaeota archaeon]|nr:MAG: 50S ribosomal protein L37ae [Candidatus Bathyarchaeota archaeon]
MVKKRTKKVGPTRGFGARYGVTLRKRYREIIVEMKKKHKCPQCGFAAVKRESVGIWVCRKCGYKFTGGAYTPFTKIGATAKRIAARGA